MGLKTWIAVAFGVLFDSPAVGIDGFVTNSERREKAPARQISGERRR